MLSFNHDGLPITRTIKRVQSRVYLRSLWQLRRLSTVLFVWSLSVQDSRACSVMAVFVGIIGFALPVSLKKIACQYLDFILFQCIFLDWCNRYLTRSVPSCSPGGKWHWVAVYPDAESTRVEDTSQAEPDPSLPDAESTRIETVAASSRLENSDSLSTSHESLHPPIEISWGSQLEEFVREQFEGSTVGK